MRFWGHLGVFAGAGLLVAACTVQPKLPPPSTDIDETVFRTHVRMLASDDFEGRKPGTPGEEKTVAYLVEQFRKLGLKPGNGESFLQPVPMVESVAAADASLAISGSGATLTLAYGKDMVIWSKRAVPQAELKHSGLVFAGYGIVAPEYAWNDYGRWDYKIEEAARQGAAGVLLIHDTDAAGYGWQVVQNTWTGAQLSLATG